MNLNDIPKDQIDKFFNTHRCANCGEDTSKNPHKHCVVDTANECKACKPLNEWETTSEKHTCVTPVNEWKIDFMDFYMERGKYEGRRLGHQGYIDFIQNLLTTHSAHLVERIEGMKKEGHNGKICLDLESGCTECENDAYNQALDQAIDIVKNK